MNLQHVAKRFQRLLLSFHVGAAVLYVVTSVAEQRYEGFSAEIRNQLALIRFPWYYGFGFVVIGLALVCGVIRLLTTTGDRGDRVVMGLTATALGLLVADYVFVYQPLAEMMTVLADSRGDRFTQYHELSKYVNLFQVLCCAVAAVIACRETPTA